MSAFSEFNYYSPSLNGLHTAIISQVTYKYDKVFLWTSDISGEITHMTITEL